MPTMNGSPETELLDIPILIVDDLADNRDLIEELLRDQGYRHLAQSADGESALKLLKAQSDFGLVLLDIMMPGIDGYAVCERITSDPATSHIPVIIVTGAAARRGQSFTRSFDAGAMDFLQKPIDETELLVRTRSALMLFRERRRCHNALWALSESQRRYELAVNGVNDGIWDLNLATDQLYLSP